MQTFQLFHQTIVIFIHVMLYRFLSSGLRVVVVDKTVLSCDKRPMYVFKEICLTEILSHCVITEPGNEHTGKYNLGKT